MNVREITHFLSGHRFTFNSERKLQDGIAQSLTSAGIEHTREHHLSAADIPDFMVGSIAVEVKVAGSFSSVLRQLHRYAQYEQVTGLVLVTNRARHHAMPLTINHKPVAVHSLVMGNAF